MSALRNPLALESVRASSTSSKGIEKTASHTPHMIQLNNRTTARSVFPTLRRAGRGVGWARPITSTAHHPLHIMDATGAFESENDLFRLARRIA